MILVESRKSSVTIKGQRQSGGRTSIVTDNPYQKLHSHQKSEPKYEMGILQFLFFLSFVHENSCSVCCIGVLCIFFCTVFSLSVFVSLCWC
jgi:hypothetical protein